MKKLFTYITISLASIFYSSIYAQTPEQLLTAIRAKLDKVKSYEATGRMKTNVVFIKAPVARVKISYQKPDKLQIKNESGVSFIPKGTMNVNVGNLFAQGNDFDVIDIGKEAGSGLRVLKLLPKNDNADIVLATLYIDEKSSLIKKSKTTTKDNGTYELDMTYGKYAEYGLADKVIFTFNTREYKLPKGVTFDYDDGTKKDAQEDKLKGKKGRVEIVYSSYEIKI